jgi:hypothetical protein
MARTFTGTQLTTQVRERADMENMDFVSDAEILRFISSSYAELYELLVKANPDFYQTEETFTGDGSTQDFNCASDWYGTVGVDYEYDATAGIFVALRQLSPAERNHYTYTGGSPAQGYRFIYNSQTQVDIRLMPTPASGETYRHTYIVAPADITSGATSLDGVAGWEEYIVVDAATKCAQKEESSTTHLEREKAALLARIEAMAENRTIGSAGRIARVGATDSFDPAEHGRLRRWR